MGFRIKGSRVCRRLALRGKTLLEGYDFRVHGLGFAGLLFRASGVLGWLRVL